LGKLLHGSGSHFPQPQIKAMIRITSQLDLNEYLNNYSKKKFLIPIYNSIKKKKKGKLAASGSH
jgi:hypothetical protein